MIGQLYKEFGYKFGQMPKAMAYRCDLSTTARSMFTGVDSLTQSAQITAFLSTVATVTGLAPTNRKSTLRYLKECVQAGYMDVEPQPGINRPHRYYTKLPAYVLEHDQKLAAVMREKSFQINLKDWPPARWPGQPAGAVQLTDGTWFKKVDLDQPPMPWELPQGNCQCGRAETSGVSLEPQPNDSGQEELKNPTGELLKTEKKYNNGGLTAAGDKKEPGQAGRVSEKCDKVAATVRPPDYCLVATDPATRGHEEAPPLPPVAAPAYWKRWVTDLCEIHGFFYLWDETGYSIADKISYLLGYDAERIRGTWLNFLNDTNPFWKREKFPLAALLKKLNQYVPPKKIHKPVTALGAMNLCGHNGGRLFEHRPAKNPTNPAENGYAEVETCADCKTIMQTHWRTAADVKAEETRPAMQPGEPWDQYLKRIDEVAV